MSWQIFLVINIIAYSFSFILQKSALKSNKIDPIAYSIVYSLLTGTLIAFYAITQGFSLDNLQDNIHNVFFMVCLNTLGNVFMFKALKLIEASEYTILFTTRSLWSILAAILFLGESFTFLQIVGTLLVIASVVFVSWKPAKYSLSKGEFYTLGAAFCFGFSFINDAFITLDTDASSYLSLAFILPGLALWALYPKATKKMAVLFEPVYFSRLMLIAVLFGSSVISIFMAFKLGRNAAQISSLGQITTIVVVLLSFIFLNERHSMVRKIIGVGVCFAGVLLVT